MKEPNEVKTMQDAIRKVYQNKKNSRIKENYKNIDVLPTVYDSPDVVNLDNLNLDDLNLDDSNQEGFKGFKNMGKKMTKPFKKWKAPYTGPPLDGPIKDIYHHSANNINKMILTGENLLSSFAANGDFLKKVFPDSSKKTTYITMKELLGPFDTCPCIKIYPFNVHKLSYWYQFIAFFTNYIPCLINGYSDLVVRLFTTEDEYVIKQDKEIVKTSIIEFFYIFIAGYLSMMFFYYTVMDTSNFVDPTEFLPRTGNSTFDFFIMDRLAEYMLLPIKMFNMFFTDLLPYFAGLLGLLPFAKLNYIYLFMISIAMVFNGIVETFADMAKKSFQFKSHMLIYALTILAIVIKLFDMDIIFNASEYFAMQNLWYVYIPLVLITMIVAIIFAPVTQLIFVIYVFNLFFLRPLSHLFEELNETVAYLFDPSNDLSCDIQTGEFFGELSRIISKYIFPVMFPLVLMIFFGYRTYLASALHSSALRTIMYMINTVCIVLILTYIFFIVNNETKMSRNVDIETRFDSKGEGQEPSQTYSDPTEQTPPSDSTTSKNERMSLEETIGEKIKTNDVIQPESIVVKDNKAYQEKMNVLKEKIQAQIKAQNETKFKDLSNPSSESPE